MKNCLGIEIGHYRIKIAYAEKGELKEFISEKVQGIDLTDMRACADLIRDLLKEYVIKCKNVIFVIKPDDAYVRRFELPKMTEEQLKLNLPYEFHDYIGDDTDKYVFDYAVVDAADDDRDQRRENDSEIGDSDSVNIPKGETMHIIGAACSKELSQGYKKLAKLAHLKLVGLVPAVLGFGRILEYSVDDEDRKKDYAILDLGTSSMNIHFFKKGIYDITRSIEPGCYEIELIRSGDKDKMRELGIEADEENRDEADNAKLNAVLEEQYKTRAVQVMRVMNFYSFNNVNNTIDSLYCCGGGARYKGLLDALEETLDLPVRSIADLCTEIAIDDDDEENDWIDSPQTYGVLL